MRRLRAMSRGRDERGASAVEYGLLVAAIAAVIVGVVFGLGGMVDKTFTDTVTCISIQANGPICN
jgi:pilus assembly protein Flp/PilA